MEWILKVRKTFSSLKNGLLQSKQQWRQEKVISHSYRKRISLSLQKATIAHRISLRPVSKILVAPFIIKSLIQSRTSHWEKMKLTDLEMQVKKRVEKAKALELIWTSLRIKIGWMFKSQHLALMEVYSQRASPNIREKLNPWILSKINQNKSTMPQAIKVVLRSMSQTKMNSLSAPTNTALSKWLLRQ